MKRERHPAGTTSDIQERRRLEQARYDYAMRQLIASREPGFLVLPCIVFLLWLTWGMPKATPVLMAATVASTLGTAMLAANYATLHRLARRKVYIETPEGNDPTGAADALDVLIDALKAPRRDGKALRNAYVQAVDALQGLRPQRPLSQLVREGYYPSRPRRSVEDGEEPEIVNYDVKPYEWHWDGVRVDFARSLAVMRDTMDGIMARHVIAARSVLADQTRFIEQRHGASALDG